MNDHLSVCSESRALLFASAGIVRSNRQSSDLKEICMPPPRPALLNGGSNNNERKSASPSGESSDFVADKFEMKEHGDAAADTSPTLFLVMMLLLGACPRFLLPLIKDQPYLHTLTLMPLNLRRWE